jgi:sugar/nucleoside kinase (ribokinase family)
VDKTLDVFGIGNAIVDILAMVPDEFIQRQSLARNAMTLVDAARQAKILHELDHHQISLASGGAAANTLVAVAQSGGTGIFCGRVAADPNGEFYRQDMEEAGIRFPVAMAPESADPTGTCVVLTTPDAERTMCTHLGVSTTLSVNDLDFDLLETCRFSFVEGYLWDAPKPHAACLETLRQSRRRGVRASFTFSDPFLVDRYRDEFREVVPECCDILFCNADEARSLFEEPVIEKCFEQISSMAPLVFVTDGEKGCTVLENGKATVVPAFRVKAIDTVGAGDAFAGGVLYGLARRMSSTRAARWGNWLAGQVVSQIGPRLEGSQASHRDTVLSGAEQ